jgi:hypothetical protein
MSKARMAGELLKRLGGTSKDLLFGGMTKGQIAGRLAPDALFGVLAATQTPGDMGDKLIAGGASAIGGGLGGLALGRAVGRMGGGEALQTVSDFAGSIGGDIAGMAVGDQIMRGKDLVMGGQGLTPYERMSAEQQAAFAAELERNILAQYGLLPGTREQYANPTTGYGVA